MTDRQSYEDERLKNHNKALNALVFKAGRWTAHALRRSASTLMSQFGISDDLTDACLNRIKQVMRRSTPWIGARPSRCARSDGPEL